MREVVEIEGREAVPPRAVPFLTDWRRDQIPGQTLPKVSGLFHFPSESLFSVRCGPMEYACIRRRLGGQQERYESELLGVSESLSSKWLARARRRAARARFPALSCGRGAGAALSGARACRQQVQTEAA